MRVVELFAGVGGFRLGLGNSHETVFFSQWEPGAAKQWAYECYVAHFGNISGELGKYTGIDIAQVDKTLIPDHDLLCGGFPCQDYSVAHSLSSSKGIEGKKGVLWWQIREILEVKRPAKCLFENVDRLLKSPASQRGRDFGIMLSCLNSLGYSVEWRVINAADYGGPQKRRRVFIYAEHRALPRILDKAFPISNEPEYKEGEIWDDLELMTDKFSFAFENSGYMTDGKIYTAKVDPVKEKPILLKDILIKGADEKYYISEDKLEKWRYQKGAKRIERTAKNGHKYTFSEGACPFPDKLDEPARTMLTSEGTLNRSSHVVEDPWTKKYRILTPQEAEKIQGFPVDWTDTMPDRNRFFCMGNALVVPMIERISKFID